MCRLPGVRLSRGQAALGPTGPLCTVFNLSLTRDKLRLHFRFPFQLPWGEAGHSFSGG
jgi:hypothetical protein